MAYNYSPDANSEVNDEKVSKINSAGIMNITLENLWRESYSALARGDFMLWNSKLDAVWSMLAGDGEEGDENDKKMIAINLKIYEQGNLKKQNITGFVKNENENSSLQYQWLLKKAVFLRRLQNKQGKGTAYQSLDDDDID